MKMGQKKHVKASWRVDCSLSVHMVIVYEFEIVGGRSVKERNKKEKKEVESNILHYSMCKVSEKCCSKTSPSVLSQKVEFCHTV